MISRTPRLTCPPERAFALFTGEASAWWPANRRHTGDAGSAVILEPAGAFFERARDGRRVELGKVRVWEPPVRIVLDFYPGTDPDHPTEATITFRPDRGGTLITLEHRPSASSEALWESRAPRYAESWALVFEAFAGHAKDAA